MERALCQRRGERLASRDDRPGSGVLGALGNILSQAAPRMRERKQRITHHQHQRREAAFLGAQQLRGARYAHGEGHALEKPESCRS